MFEKQNVNKDTNKLKYSHRKISKDWPKLDKMTDLEKSVFFYLINKYKI